MTIKERLHQKIEELDDVMLTQLAQTIADLEAEQTKQKDIEEKIALWEALAEPDESIDWAEFEKATERCPDVI